MYSHIFFYYVFYTRIPIINIIDSKVAKDLLVLVYRTLNGNFFFLNIYFFSLEKKSKTHNYMRDTCQYLCF